MLRHTVTSVCAGFALLATSALLAQENNELSQRQMEDILAVKVRSIETLAYHPKLIAAVRAQNAENLVQNTILERDKAWRDTPELTTLKRSLQNNAPGRVLRRLVNDNPWFNEAFLTDNQGANVAAYPATSDYWQGDEDKWIASFNNGQGQLFIGPLERDESTQTVAVQISAPVRDGDETIGVLVVGVALSYLENKQQ